MAAPQHSELSMSNDLEAMHAALRSRGYLDAEILELEGEMTRAGARAWLEVAARRIESWRSGSVFLYYTGHGSPTSLDESTAEAALQFADVSDEEGRMSWDEVFDALRTPAGVELVVLPDS